MSDWKRYVRLSKDEYEAEDATARNNKLSAKLSGENNAIKTIELDDEPNGRAWYVIYASNEE